MPIYIFYGWNIEDGKYSINWLNWTMTPQTIKDILDLLVKMSVLSL